MASFKFKLLQYQKSNGMVSVVLQIIKDRSRKCIATGLAASPEQWDENAEQYVPDKKIVPKFKEWNLKLSEFKIRIDAIVRNFEIEKIDWTLNQFEAAFLNKTPKGNAREYIVKLIDTLRETGHVGNSVCYKGTLHMLELFDKKFGQKIFAEIDLKYVKSFDVFLQKRECKGNTRKYYMKALRAILNKAIQDKEAPESTYPFGKNGFNISSLEEVTAKRYLPSRYLDKLKNEVQTDVTYEKTRRMFLFCYYCYGIAYIDAAMLTAKNIVEYDGGSYIVYKRHKTKEAKAVKPIYVKITDEIQSQLDWFKQNTALVDDYLLPIVSIKGYTGEKLYNHIRCRYWRNNKNLNKLSELLGLENFKLTTYVSRHTFAMKLQNSYVPREIISQALGHSDIKTTQIYLDSFNSEVLDDVAKVL